MSGRKYRSKTLNFGSVELLDHPDYEQGIKFPNFTMQLKYYPTAKAMQKALKRYDPEEDWITTGGLWQGYKREVCIGDTMFETDDIGCMWLNRETADIEMISHEALHATYSYMERFGVDANPPVEESKFVDVSEEQACNVLGRIVNVVNHWLDYWEDNVYKS